MMRIIFFAILFSFSAEVFGQAVSETGRSIRSLGMGGMYIPVVNDAEALFYNPANLNNVPGFDFKIADIGLGANGLQAAELVQHLSEISDPSQYNDLFGKRIYANASARSAVAVPHFAVGYLTDYQAVLEVHNPVSPSVNTYFLNDQITAVGTSFSVGPGISAGFNLKQVRRWGGTTQDLSLTTVSGSSGLTGLGTYFNDKGIGYGSDIGLSAALNTAVKANVSAVLYDVGGTSFAAYSGVAPPRREQNLALGVGGGLDLPGLDITFGAEARHLLEPEVSAGKKIHLGAELSLPFIDLRAGINQGYLTYGAGFNFFFFRLDATSYTEELGSYPGQTAENRLMVGLTFDMSFDVDFKLSDGSGRKRKLKQRR